MTTKQPHPTYPNPAIIEALCEIHLRLEGGVVWKPSLVGDLFKELQPDFPELEPVPELGIEFSVRDAAIEQRLLAPRTRFRFKHCARPLFAQLGPGVFSMNVLAPYPGWSTFKEDILRTWSHATAVVNPVTVTRVGLRYINRIFKTNERQEPAEWLRANAFLPAAALTSCPGFSARTESAADGANRTIVTLRDERPGESSRYGAIILDIDRIIEESTPPDAETLGPRVDALHEDVWTLFDDATTDELETVLRRRG